MLRTLKRVMQCVYTYLERTAAGWIAVEHLFETQRLKKWVLELMASGSEDSGKVLGFFVCV